MRTPCRLCATTPEHSATVGSCLPACTPENEKAAQPPLGVRGQLQREGIVTHVIAKEFIDLTPQMRAISGGMGEAVAAALPSGRNFH